MDDTLCSNFDILRMHLPAKLGGTAKRELKNIIDFQNYCHNDNCNTDLEKITVGFLWLLGKYYSISQNRSYNENNTNPFFLYMISWFSYQLNKITGHNSTTINDFYNKKIKNNDKYKKFRDDSSKFTNLDEDLNKKSDFLNINIKDLSKFYDPFKLLCSMYGNAAMNINDATLSNTATSFVNTYTELNNNYNAKGTAYSQILSALSTDYNNLKTKCKDCSSLPAIKTTQNHVLSSKNNSEQSSGQSSRQFSAKTYEVTSSSSIGNKLFTVLSIFGAIAFFLGISYKYSLFGFRKRAQKQYLREKIRNIKKKMSC
ncbi:BIR protein [Plasmodium berghei]|uniref:BIR protein n=2 Tax=Plasmodium berghei TaxID=5821 RepID=A0A077X781_PLABA|nr:BIR protein [Plasmodium berghei ANKA]CXH21493.1 BIR protein [Plasmodium berghei]SBW38098.1 BIR protein [Plasmodium berghei]SCL82373.1 BIR protein [Plasmodium berghei]SCL82399.1 BIR protein [Plasmodium berghei]SCL85607.1 BIR protein [Plasmodium berghei]|eukprot:XP_034420050.1 BIR protein [Plasmodium berghei ANKA]